MMQKFPPIERTETAAYYVLKERRSRAAWEKYLASTRKQIADSAEAAIQMFECDNIESAKAMLRSIALIEREDAVELEKQAELDSK